MTKQKIIIVEYARSVMDPNIIVAYTSEGGRIELVLCRVPEKRRTRGELYTNGKKLFFSLTRRGLRQVFEHLGPTSRTRGRSCHNGKRGNIYPQMREYGNATCHSLVCTAYHGTRPVINGIRYVCDHKNGDVMNWAEDNLEWISPRENSWRARHVLQVLRAKGFDLPALSGADMDKWFAIIRALETAGRKPIKMDAAELRALFDKYRLVNPAERMEYEMTHHMEL